jgi:hypothetical protein
VYFPAVCCEYFPCFRLECDKCAPKLLADYSLQRQMYERLGFQWASTLLAFLSLLFVPIPIWWFYKGRALRMKSPFARFVETVLPFTMLSWS